MAAPSRVGSPVVEAQPAFAGSYTLTLPASPTDGNVLVAILTSANVTATPNFTLTGWTEVLEIGNNGTNSSQCCAAVWYRVASSEPASYTINAASGTATGHAVCIELSGATTPEDNSLSAETESGPQATLTAASMDTNVDDCYVLAAFSVEEGPDAPYTLSGTGWSEIVNATTGTDGFDNGIVIGEKTVATAGVGTTENAIVTPTTSAEGAWFQISFGPSAAGSIIPQIMNNYRQRRA